MNKKKCSLCGGALYFLGKLGPLAWFRCENCGMEFSKSKRRNKRHPSRKKGQAKSMLSTSSLVRGIAV